MQCCKLNKKEQNTEVMKFNSRQLIYYLKKEIAALKRKLLRVAWFNSESKHTERHSYCTFVFWRYVYSSMQFLSVLISKVGGGKTFYLLIIMWVGEKKSSMAITFQLEALPLRNKFVLVSYAVLRIQLNAQVVSL